MNVNALRLEFNNKVDETTVNIDNLYVEQNGKRADQLQIYDKPTQKAVSVKPISTNGIEGFYPNNYYKLIVTDKVRSTAGNKLSLFDNNMKAEYNYYTW
mgnify:FL=1